ncbi:hypothetical protein [Corallococcus caeni]|uniref:Uncharacterized protein n=1 Tax=Corallococcus caeni TaxID=3082388 RepID=A0ABQ6QTI4_9BACT|nr:hypothetical protein ASNO1_34140 [Corallococcus sp. NO1]
MDAFDLVIISVIVALGLGRFLVMRDQRRASPAEESSPRKPTPQRIAGRVLLGYAYAMALFLVVRFLISRM